MGPNNVGKSTICEALDLVLGHDRLNKFPPVEEFDFYNGKYVIPGDDLVPIPILVEVTLTRTIRSRTETISSNHRELSAEARVPSREGRRLYRYLERSTELLHRTSSVGSRLTHRHRSHPLLLT